MAHFSTYGTKAVRQWNVVSGRILRDLNQTVSTLRFFFRITLGRADIVNPTQFVHEPRKLPVVLSPEEVVRFAYAGPRCTPHHHHGAGIRKPSQKRRLKSTTCRRCQEVTSEFRAVWASCRPDLVEALINGNSVVDLICSMVNIDETS